MIIQGKVWGHTTPLFNRNNVELHIAEIKKGGYCSKHAHKFKYNRFIVLKGSLKVTIWKDYGNGTSLEDISHLGVSQECTVNPGDFHKFEALEDTTVLEVYWVELNENDIVRLDQGGVINHAKAADQRAEAESYRGDRPAIFNDELAKDLYGTKYFGNEGNGHSLR
jgi:tellurite resistance-related uncharacterized protein